MNGRGNFSAAAFLIDYEDRLFTTIIQSATGPFESVGNSGNSENVGFELEQQSTMKLTPAVLWTSSGKVAENMRVCLFSLTGMLGLLMQRWMSGITVGELT